MNDWFRSWHGAPTDNKWLVIARKAGVAPGLVSAVVWALLDHASQAKQRGSVQDFDAETYAAFSGFDEDDIKKVLAALVEKGVVVDGSFAAWGERQPKRDDGAAERARSWRERNRTQPNATEQERTLDKRREDTEKKEESPAAREQIDTWLRTLVNTEPVALDPDTEPVVRLLDAGFTVGDIEGGIRAAMAEPSFRPRAWKQLVGWIRRAAKDRLAANPRADPVGAAPAATGMSDELWRGFCKKWLQAKSNWPLHKTCDPPDHPNTKVPRHILIELEIVKDQAA